MSAHTTTPSLLPVAAPRAWGAYTDSTLKRQLSDAVLQVMASTLNVKCRVDPTGDDIDSVDAEFDSGRFGPGRQPLGINRKLEVQLKCTIASELRSMPHPLTGQSSWRYYLDVKDYERLAIPQADRPYPHVLVVMRVPRRASERMLTKGNLTLIRARAWWLDLTDFPPPTHTSREPVYLPKHQLFDVPALAALMKEPA